MHSRCIGKNHSGSQGKLQQERRNSSVAWMPSSPAHGFPFVCTQALMCVSLYVCNVCPVSVQVRPTAFSPAALTAADPTPQEDVAEVKQATFVEAWGCLLFNDKRHDTWFMMNDEWYAELAKELTKSSNRHAYSLPGVGNECDVVNYCGVVTLVVS